MIILVLLLLAIIFAALAMVNVPSGPRFQWLGAAIFFWLVYVLLSSPHVVPLR